MLPRPTTRCDGDVVPGRYQAETASLPTARVDKVMEGPVEVGGREGFHGQDRGRHLLAVENPVDLAAVEWCKHPAAYCVHTLDRSLSRHQQLYHTAGNAHAGTLVAFKTLILN